MRVAPLMLFAVALPVAAQTPAKRTVEFSGLVLVNGFYNSAHVANVDVPLLADTDNVGVKSAGGTIRQTRLGVLLSDPDVLGGSFAGEVDADFYGGQQPSSGGRGSPWPPVWLSAGPQNRYLGAAVRPSRIAWARPASPPPGSRTVVNPRPSAPASRLAPARAR